MASKMEFKIEQGIAIPTASNDHNRKYPFSAMKVGDSFAINGVNSAAVANAAYAFGAKNKMKFSVRRTSDGHRCWRKA